MEAAVASEDLEAAWAEGYIAGYGAQPVETDPYPADTKMSDVWKDGWQAGHANR